MNITEARTKMTDIRSQRRALLVKGDKSKDVQELQEIRQQLDTLDVEYDLAEQDFLDAISITQERSASPVGVARILGTYGVATAQNTTERSEKGMYTPDEERRSSQEYRTAFFKVMTGKATLEERALVTLDTGAAIIPTTTFNEVLENIRKAQGLIGRVRILNVPGKLSVPVADIQTPAAWHVEGAPIGDTTAPPTNVDLTGFELAKLFSLSAATQAMSISAFESYLTEELGRAMRDAISAAIPSGAGTTEPLGILNGFVWGVTNSVSYASAPTVENLTAAMKLLASNFRQNAAWSCNSAYFYDVLAPLADANGHPIFARDLASGAPLSLMGKSIVIDDFLPDDTLLFGDYSKYFLNFSAPASIQRSSEAGFTSATVLYRGLAVVDGKPICPAFIKVSKA